MKVYFILKNGRQYRSRPVFTVYIICHLLYINRVQGVLPNYFRLETTETSFGTIRTKRLFRLFRFYTETASFGVSIKPKQTEGQPKQTEKQVFPPQPNYSQSLLQFHTVKQTKMNQGSEFFTKRQKLLSSLRRNLFVQQLQLQ